MIDSLLMLARFGFHVIAQDDTYVVGLWNNVFVTMWRHSPTVERLRLISTHHRLVDRRFTDGFCALAVLSMASLRMEPAARAEATLLAASPGNHLKAIAQVIQGTGFAGAATRAIATSMTLLRRSKVPTKCFDDVSTGIGWLLPHIVAVPPGGSLAHEDLVLALNQAWA